LFAVVFEFESTIAYWVPATLGALIGTCTQLVPVGMSAIWTVALAPAMGFDGTPLAVAQIWTLSGPAGVPTSVSKTSTWSSWPLRLGVNTWAPAIVLCMNTPSSGAFVCCWSSVPLDAGEDPAKANIAPATNKPSRPNRSPSRRNPNLIL
jgi:hypothetical protein